MLAFEDEETCVPGVPCNGCAVGPRGSIIAEVGQVHLYAGPPNLKKKTAPQSDFSQLKKKKPFRFEPVNWLKALDRKTQWFLLSNL